MSAGEHLEPAPCGGDPFAERAFRRHHRQVFRYLLRRGGSHDLADELTQRVFTDALVSLRRSKDEPRSILAWLYTIAERRFADEMRRRERAERTEFELEREETAPEAAYGREAMIALKRAIERLPAEQREAVVLKLLRGQTFSEIAATTGASEGACKMRFSRGMKQLRMILSEEGFSPA